MNLREDSQRTINLSCNHWIIAGLTFAFSFLVSFELSGQSDRQSLVKISGVVFESDSLIPLPNAHFQILHKNIAGMTNPSGRFEVLILSGDTLKFTFVGYKDSYYKVVDTLNVGEYVIGVFLTRDTIQIQEVVVYPRRKDLRQDFLGIKTEQNLQLDNAKRNINISTYQGLNGKQVLWDSDEAYKMAYQKRKMEAENLGMVAPDQMVGINFLVLIPYVLYKLNNPEVTKPPDDIYISETEYENLLNEYKIQLKKKSFTKTDSVNRSK